MTNRIDTAKLIEKLESLDDRLLNVWLQDHPPLSDDERWDIFVTLLETRVSLLKVCRDAGLALGSEQIVPPWLERLTTSRVAIQRREIRRLDEERKLRQRLGVYETVAKPRQPERSEEP